MKSFPLGREIELFYTLLLHPPTKENLWARVLQLAMPSHQASAWVTPSQKRWHQWKVCKHASSRMPSQVPSPGGRGAPPLHDMGKGNECPSILSCCAQGKASLAWVEGGWRRKAPPLDHTHPGLDLRNGLQGEGWETLKSSFLHVERSWGEWAPYALAAALWSRVCLVELGWGNRECAWVKCHTLTSFAGIS